MDYIKKLVKYNTKLNIIGGSTTYLKDLPNLPKEWRQVWHTIGQEQKLKIQFIYHNKLAYLSDLPYTSIGDNTFEEKYAKIYAKITQERSKSAFKRNETNLGIDALSIVAQHDPTLSGTINRLSKQLYIEEPVINSMIAKLLKDGRNVETPLMTAAKFGNIERVRTLIKNPDICNMIDQNGDTALHYATTYNQPQIMDILINSCGQLNTVSNSGTPLYISVIKNLIDPFKLLLHHGANFNIKDGENKTLLHHAIFNKNTEITLILIDIISKYIPNEINTRDYYGMTPFSYACYRNNTELIELLISKNADITTLDNKGNTTLHWVSKNNNTKIAKILIEKGININTKNLEGKTPLAVAYTRTPDMRKFLIENGGTY
jgi:ankyrin repeat protein